MGVVVDAQLVCCALLSWGEDGDVRLDGWTLDSPLVFVYEICIVFGMAGMVDDNEGIWK